MGSFSRIPAVSPLRIVIGNKEREVRSLTEAKRFLREQKAGALADFILADVDTKAPGALVAFRDRLEMVRSCL